MFIWGCRKARKTTRARRKNKAYTLLHAAGILQSGRKIFRDGTLTLTTGLKVKANFYWLALQLAKMRQWPAVKNMEPEQLEKMQEAERKGILLYDFSSSGYGTFGYREPRGGNRHMATRGTEMTY